MTIILSLLAQILHIGLMIVAAPTVAGALDWLDASAERAIRSADPVALARPGASVAQAPMTVESVSVVSRLAPALGLGATLSAAALVPSFTLGMALAPLADVLVIVSLLTVARVAAGLGALDSGAALPGLAAQNGERNGGPGRDRADACRRDARADRRQLQPRPDRQVSSARGFCCQPPPRPSP